MYMNVRISCFSYVYTNCWRLSDLLNHRRFISGFISGFGFGSCRVAGHTHLLVGVGVGFFRTFLLVSDRPDQTQLLKHGGLCCGTGLWSECGLVLEELSAVLNTHVLTRTASGSGRFFSRKKQEPLYSASDWLTLMSILKL